MVYVDDLAKGFRLAAETLARLVVRTSSPGNEAPTLNELVGEIADVAHVRAVRWHLPVWPFWLWPRAACRGRLRAARPRRPPIFRRRGKVLHQQPLVRYRTRAARAQVYAQGFAHEGIGRTLNFTATSWARSRLSVARLRPSTRRAWWSVSSTESATSVTRQRCCFVIDRDPRGRFAFAPLQSEYAAGLCAGYRYSGTPSPASSWSRMGSDRSSAALSGR